MHDSLAIQARILSIDPTPKGLGFTILEGRDGLMDWGVKTVRQDKNAGTLAHVEKLINRFHPTTIVVEDTGHWSSRRRGRIRALLEEVRLLAAAYGIRFKRIPRALVHASFASLGRTTKYQIAVALTDKFPELSPRLPKPRKPWQSEDDRMAIFDAAALAVTHVEATRGSVQMNGARYEA